MNKRCRPALILPSVVLIGALAGCSAPENTLATHLGQPLASFSGITDDIYTLSLTQDDRLGALERDANQVAPEEPGWLIVAICADTPTIDPAVTENVILRVVAEEFVDDSSRAQIEEGEFQDGVVCGNAASTGPDLSASNG